MRLIDIAHEFLSGKGPLTACIGDVKELRNSIVLMHAHCLPSIVPLLHSLLELGIPSTNLIFVPKSYSTIVEARDALIELGITVIEQRPFLSPREYDQRAAESLKIACESTLSAAYQRGISRIILCDDGGMLSEHWYRLIGDCPAIKVVSVQQTTSGIKRKHRLSPVAKIDVSRSPSKQFLESQFIAAAIVRKAQKERLIEPRMQVGVVGIGAIGGPLARQLIDAGCQVTTYDRNSAKHVQDSHTAQHPHELLRRSSVVFGCTGQNWTRSLSSVKRLRRPIKFASCSSRAVEFQWLIFSGICKSHQEPFSLVECSLAKWQFQVLNGGFPLNFDRVTEWEADHEIWLTRALVLLGILQATELEASDVRIHPLSLSGQALVVRHWLSDHKATSPSGTSRKEAERCGNGLPPEINSLFCTRNGSTNDPP